MKSRDRKTRIAEATPAADLVAHILDGYHLSDRIRRVRLHLEWRRLVGERLAARTRPESLHGGVLYVLVWDSSWLHQLSFIRDDVIAKINTRMGDPPMISEIRFKVGRIHPRNHIPLPVTRPKGPALPRARAVPEAATGERLEEIKAETACIEDDELRAIVTDFRRRWNL